MNTYPSIAYILGASYLLFEDDEKPKNEKKSREWVRDWVEKRSTEGCYVKLLQELRENQPKLYKNFVRMSAADFDFLLGLVGPLIQKKDTVMRKSIPVGERLALTLRFLATGESFMSLQYTFRIPQCTISSIIPEVCDAIYMVLKEEYMKVSIIFEYLFCILIPRSYIRKKYLKKGNVIKGIAIIIVLRDRIM